MSASYLEASARNRILGLLDPDSFVEFLGPTARVTSPHLPGLDMPVAFDDGVAVGEGTINEHKVLIAAQEGRFMGGAVGEVHGAKLTGLLERAEEFDSQDRALVWRTMGLKHRRLLGEIDRVVADDVAAFRNATQDYFGRSRPLTLDMLEAQHEFLANRLARFQDCRDAREVWSRLGVNEPARVPDLEPDQFESLAGAIAVRRP